MTKYLCALLLSILLSLVARAETVEMADYLRNSGKLYAVVAVLVVVFLGIVFFLVRLERKLSKIEKHISDEG